MPPNSPTECAPVRAPLSPSLVLERAWVTRCEELAREAKRGDGCSYTWYVVRLSEAVDLEVIQLPEAFRSRALELAGEFGYASRAEREVEQVELANDGCCMHGIELGCCPAGCGSGPDD